MVKRCKEYGEMMQRIHTISHGEMVKHTSEDILLAKWEKRWNVYTNLRQPSLSRPPLTMGTNLASWLHQLLHPPSRLWEEPCWSSNSPTSRSDALWCRIPPLILINAFLLCLPYATSNTGGGLYPFATSSFSPLFDVPILAIYYIISVLM